MQLEPLPAPAVPVQIPAPDCDRDRFTAAILADLTRRAYAYDWKLFRAWCAATGRAELSADGQTVEVYIMDMLRCGAKISSAKRRFHAIAHYYQSRGIALERSGVLQLLVGAQRLRGEKPRRRRPLTITELRSMSEALLGLGTKIAIRDRAVILLGFASALRSASIAALNLDDVEFCDEGMVLTIQREKNDQEARGRLVGIPHGKHETTCAVRAVRDWLEVRSPGATCGRLFLGLTARHKDRPIERYNVCRIVKRCVAMIGLDPTLYGAHSLRAGFITAAGEAGVSDLLIAEQSGHRSLNCLREYLRRTNVFRSNACSALDL